MGLASAVVQGGLIRRLVPRFGEPRLILAGIALLAAGMLLLAGTTGPPALVAATLVLALGQGLVSPTLSGLLSRVTPAGEQGAVFGTLSSAQTLARTVSYAGANVLFARVGPSSPYWAGGALAAATLGLAWTACRRAEREAGAGAGEVAGAAPATPSSR
jgi:DHA1 family tetracycline resistance protein-like MFS transporter